MGLCTRCCWGKDSWHSCWRWGALSPVAFSTFASRVNQGMSDGWMSILRCTCVSSKPFCLVSEEIDLEESQELQHSCSEISSYLYKVPYLCLMGLLWCFLLYTTDTEQPGHLQQRGYAVSYLLAGLLPQELAALVSVSLEQDKKKIQYYLKYEWCEEIYSSLLVLVSSVCLVSAL